MAALSELKIGDLVRVVTPEEAKKYCIGGTFSAWEFGYDKKFYPIAYINSRIGIVTIQFPIKEHCSFGYKADWLIKWEFIDD